MHSDESENLQVFMEVCERMGLRKTRVIIHLPQSDGLVERFNHMLTIVTSQHHQVWYHHPPCLWVDTDRQYRRAQAAHGCSQTEQPNVPRFEDMRDPWQLLAGAHTFAQQHKIQVGARQKRASHYDTRC